MVRKVISAYCESLSGLSRDVWVLAVAIFINRCGSMVLAFLTLYMTNELGFSIVEAGLIFSFYGVGSICGVFFSGRTIDRFGAVRVQIVCLIISAPLYMLVPLFTSFSGVAASIFLLSFFNEAVRPANATAVAQLSTEENTTRAFGLQRLAINLGFSFGPAIGGVLAEFDYKWLFIVDGTTTAIGALILLKHFGLRRHTHAVESPDKLAVSDSENAKLTKFENPAKPSPLNDRFFVCFLGLVLLNGIVFFQFHATYPKYLEEHYRLSPRMIGLIYAVNTIVVVLFEMLLLQAVRNRSMLRTIGWGCFFSCLGFGLLPFGTSYVFLVFTMMVLTFGEMLTMPLSTSFVANRSRSFNRGRSQGMYMSWYTMTYAIAGVIAPAIGGSIYAQNKQSVWYSAIVMGIIAVAGFYVLNSKRRSPVEN